MNVSDIISVTAIVLCIIGAWCAGAWFETRRLTAILDKYAIVPTSLAERCYMVVSPVSDEEADILDLEPVDPVPPDDGKLSN